METSSATLGGLYTTYLTYPLLEGRRRRGCFPLLLLSLSPSTPGQLSRAGRLPTNTPPTQPEAADDWKLAAVAVQVGVRADRIRSIGAAADDDAWLDAVQILRAEMDDRHRKGLPRSAALDPTSRRQPSLAMTPQACYT